MPSESEPRPAPPEGPSRGYVICTTPRSGSNFLGALLESTGRLGHPKEYFNGPARRRNGLQNFPDDPELQLAEVFRLGVTPNGVYGLKIFAYQFDLVRSCRWPEVLPNLSYVLLEREDVLGQAISMVRAQQTDQYRSTEPIRGETHYDGAAIGKALKGVALDQARWCFWFARTGVRPLRLRYEQIVADPQGAVDAVAALVGLVERLPVQVESLPLRIQRGEESEVWRARFVREYGERSHF